MQSQSLKFKQLRPSPKVQAAWTPAPLLAPNHNPKYVKITAHPHNKGNVYVSDSECGFPVDGDNSQPPAIDAECLRPWHSIRFDVDSNRPVGIGMSSIYFMGEHPGDSLIVTYLEESES